MKIMTRNHNFHNGLTSVVLNKKTVTLRPEKGRDSYVYRTKEIDKAFSDEDWSFFDNLDAAVIDAVDIYDTRSRIYYTIDTSKMRRA